MKEIANHIPLIFIHLYTQKAAYSGMAVALFGEVPKYVDGIDTKTNGESQSVLGDELKSFLTINAIDGSTIQRGDRY